MSREKKNISCFNREREREEDLARETDLIDEINLLGKLFTFVGSKVLLHQLQQLFRFELSASHSSLVRAGRCKDTAKPEQSRAKN